MVRIRKGSAAALVMNLVPAWPQQAAMDLPQKTLEDLTNRDVTSLSREAEKLSRTVSAVFLITQEDIRPSRPTNLPDLLRMARGFDVAEIDSNTWPSACAV
jgi:outer membrane cobalamin receptor